MAKPRNDDNFFNKLFRCTFLGESYLIFFILIMYGISFAAAGNWVAELFSHFQVQYIIFLTLFGVITLMFAFNWRMAILAFGAASYSGYTIMPQINFNKEEHATISVYDRPLKIVQFNLQNSGRDQRGVTEWVSSTGLKDYDVLVLQEASPKMQDLIEYVKGVYPYSIDKTNEGNFGTLVLSRLELRNIETLQTGSAWPNYILRFDVTKEGMGQDIRVFSLHTPPPVSSAVAKARNGQLATVASYINQDDSALKVLIGDLNLTPYSPYFKKLLDDSGLNYMQQSSIVVPEGTWPSFTFAPFLQIPIDHVLVSNGLIVDLERLSETSGSDHHPVVASIIKKRVDAIVQHP